MEIVAPNIIAFLTQQDIFSSLQHTSFAIWNVCKANHQLWRDFINQYYLGPTLQNDARLNLKLIRLITDPRRVLIDLDVIPMDVLQSVINGITSSKYMSSESQDKWISGNMEDRVSPFNKVKKLKYWENVHLQLYWSGQWGIFTRLKIEALQEDTLLILPRFQLHLEVKHIEDIRSKGKKLDAEVFIKPRILANVIQSGWTDFMIGAINVQSLLNNQSNPDTHLSFDRLHAPIDMKVSLLCVWETCKGTRLFDFAYLWPLQTPTAPLIYSQMAIFKGDNNFTTSVKLQINSPKTKVAIKEESKEDSEKDSEEENYEDEK